MAQDWRRRVGWSVLFLLVFLGCMAQQFSLGQFRDFSLPEYYDPPHATQIKSLLQGEQAIPEAEGKILIKKLKLQTFREDGAGEFIMRADDCLYDTKARSAESAGPLVMRTADGRFSTEGEGFLWCENESILIISNRVHTIFQAGQVKVPNP
jgi:hypothetical protein